MSPRGLPNAAELGSVSCLPLIYPDPFLMSVKKLDFEKALAELEALVERMEHGDQPLETALKEFELGIRLVRDCQQALTAAEQKIRVLTQSGEKPLDEQTGDKDGDNE